MIKNEASCKTCLYFKKRPRFNDKTKDIEKRDYCKHKPIGDYAVGYLLNLKPCKFYRRKDKIDWEIAIVGTMLLPVAVGFVVWGAEIHRLIKAKREMNVKRKEILQ